MGFLSSFIPITPEKNLYGYQFTIKGGKKQNKYTKKSYKSMNIRLRLPFFLVLLQKEERLQVYS